jgi:hypothetical protein
MTLLLPLVNRPTMKVKIKEPIIDQTTGKVSPSIVMGRNSGKPNCRAIHIPKKAPIKPTTAEIKQPPSE